MPDLTGLGAVADLANGVINRIWPDASEAEKGKLTLALAQLNAEVESAKGQMAVNAAEAANSSVFIAGARPFIIWVCGIGMGYVAIVEPIARFVAKVCFDYQGEFPVINTELTTQVLLGILGLGGLRTVEKIKGVARESMLK